MVPVPLCHQKVAGMKFPKESKVNEMLQKSGRGKKTHLHVANKQSPIMP
jgi:hypothetical protein